VSSDSRSAPVESAVPAGCPKTFVNANTSLVIGERVRTYAPGTPERARLATELAAIVHNPIDAQLYIGGVWRSGNPRPLFAPHDHSLQVAVVHGASERDVGDAIDAANCAHPNWSRTTQAERASVFLRAADLLEEDQWRDRITAATILGQSKSWHQAEIDAACETINSIRIGVQLAAQLNGHQPPSSAAIRNELEYRPLEGFVLAITPFNSTSIAAKHPIAPVLMGNVVVWKPSPRQAPSANVLMRLLHAAGLPPGAINLIDDEGPLSAQIALRRREFAGLHFAGSREVFNSLAAQMSSNLRTYREFPRLVGHSGGKTFVLAHRSADLDFLAVELIRGAFEYQGQRCSGISRAYIPQSLWPQLREKLRAIIAEIRPGDVADPATFMGAVISEQALRRLRSALNVAIDCGARVVTDGQLPHSSGWFFGPTILQTHDPRSTTMIQQIFGPILTVYVYADADFERTLDLIEATSMYGLAGAIYANDEQTIGVAALRFSAATFHINGSLTGDVCRQPVGGSRAWSKNDTTGSMDNLAQWTSPRRVKRSFAAMTA
jgi:1-pyrroline-5-carboxylate dehydrogenase